MTFSGRIDRTVGRTIFESDPAGYDAARLDYPGARYDFRERSMT